MSCPVTNVMFAGVGGQGIILASDMLAEIAFRSGFDMKKSEIHGMSQRGGSVSGDVRYGEKVYSPMIPRQCADYLVVLSEDQVEVCRDMLKENGKVFGPSLLGDWDPGRSLNVAMLGILNAHLKLDAALWEELIRSVFKGEVADANIETFRRGMQIGSGC